MKYLHFIHCNKNWFYQFNTSESNKSWNHPGRDTSGKWIWYSDAHSKTQALNELKNKFPNEKPILDIAYHEGPKSVFGNGKGGSRPNKVFSPKDKFRLEERRYKQQLRKKEEENNAE